MANSEGIDILALYTQSNYIEWNMFLTEARRKRDFAGLSDVYRRLQIGMENLVQQRLNSEKVCHLFLRLQRSIELTMRDIHREKNQISKSASDYNIQKTAKAKDLELLLRKARY